MTHINEVIAFLFVCTAIIIGITFYADDYLGSIPV